MEGVRGTFAVLAGKLAARRQDCAPVAGKSTLNRLELSKLEPTTPTAKAATSTIPIVFVSGADPVEVQRREQHPQTDGPISRGEESHAAAKEKDEDRGVDQAGRAAGYFRR